MEFNLKLQELRKKSGLTQEELGEKLYVSRAAISKWESGRGYPNIDSLRCLAKFFNLTVDELLSGEEIFIVAEQENKQKQNSLKDLIFGLVDLSFVMLLFIPFFAQRVNGIISEVGLINLTQIKEYLKIAFWSLTISHVVLGVVMLTQLKFQFKVWQKIKRKLSIAFTVVSVALFSLSLQPYASLLAFIFLIIKFVVAFKR